MTQQDAVTDFLKALITDVTLARKSGDHQRYLRALTAGVLYYPVFRDWDSPVDHWLEYLEDNLHGEPRALVETRHAVIAMRRGNLEEAEQQTARLVRCGTARLRCWALLTSSRIETRMQNPAAASRTLHDGLSTELPREDWIASIKPVAEGEWFLESGQTRPAIEAFRLALRVLPAELIEERIQALQSLGFAHISQADHAAAADALNQARELLLGAGIWPEVIQMDLVVGNLYLGQGRKNAARELLEEAAILSEKWPQPLLKPLIEISQARLHATLKDFSSAIVSALKSAAAFAEQGNAFGYFTAITAISNLYLQDRNFEEAYRTLVAGISIAKRALRSSIEAGFRRQIESIQSMVGPERFDAMIRAMLQKAKGADVKHT